MSYDGPIPHFIIAGSPRSGTTFLCHLLDRHPQISMAKPFIPEPKVFFSSAENHEARLMRYRNLFAEALPNQVLGDKTSNYFENNEALQRIKHDLPDVKIVVILREPVARAYSNWRWSTKNGLETLPFAEAIKLEGQRPSPLPPENVHARPFDYMARGRYGTLAKRWLAAFGPNQVRFFVYEHIAHSPEALSASLQDYLGVEQVAGLSGGLGVINAVREVREKIDSGLERQLRNIFKAEMDIFADLTGVDIGAWGYS